MKKLTRKFFEEHGWDISEIQLENDFKTWIAKLEKDCDKDGVYIRASVTNIHYKDRFAVTGYFTSDCYVTVMLYTEEDYYNLLKLARINEKDIQ